MKDSLYDEALKLVVGTQRVSISQIQRKLRIGYNRSASIVEDLETYGIVSGCTESGGRTVLLRSNT